MPPKNAAKGGNAASKKTEQKKKEKIIEVMARLQSGTTNVTGTTRDQNKSILDIIPELAILDINELELLTEFL